MPRIPGDLNTFANFLAFVQNFGEVDEQDDLGACKAVVSEVKAARTGVEENDREADCAVIKMKCDEVNCNSGGLSKNDTEKDLPGEKLELGTQASDQASVDLQTKVDDEVASKLIAQIDCIGERSEIEMADEKCESFTEEVKLERFDTYKHLGLFIILGLSD